MLSVATVTAPTTPVGKKPPGIVASGESSVLVNGLPVASLGSSVTSHSSVVASSTVLVGGKPIAHLGDCTSNGSMILTGSSNVLAG